MAPFDSIQVHTATAPITLTNLDIGWDATLTDDLTWSDGAQATITHTYAVTGTDPTIAFSDGLITLSDTTSISDLNVTSSTKFNSVNLTDAGDILPVDGTKKLGSSAAAWAGLEVDGKIGIDILPFYLNINVGSSFDFFVNMTGVVLNFDGSGAGTGTFIYESDNDLFILDTDTTVTGIGTFNEVNISSTGAANVLLALGTSDTATSGNVGLAAINSDITNPTTTGYNAGLTVEPYWTDTDATSRYGIFAKAILDGATGKITARAMQGSVDSITDITEQDIDISGVEYIVSHTANYVGNLFPPPTINRYLLKGVRGLAALGSTGKTISNLVNADAFGGHFSCSMSGVYNGTHSDGTAYGVYAETNDGGITSTAGGKDVNAYGVYIDAAVSKAFTDGNLNSFALFSPNDVPSAHLGNLRLGDTTVPTDQLEVVGVSVFGDGGATNYTQFSATGDQVFVGSAGLPFGEISKISNAVSTDFAGDGNPQIVDIFDTNGCVNETSPDQANNLITITHAGVYFIAVSATVNSSGGLGTKMEISVQKNTGAAEIIPHMDRNFSGGGGEAGVISISGCADLAATDTVEVWIENETNNSDYIVEDISLFVMQIGG